MPLTTRFLFAVMLESKVDPSSRGTDDIWSNCVFVKIWVTQSSKPAPFENRKGCGTQRQNQKQNQKQNQI
jgi:hypothetical protein